MIRFFAYHKTAANLLMIIIFVLGITSVMKMKRETFPDFSLDRVIVRVEYLGASTFDIETSVCSVIEEALDGVDGVKKIVSRSTEGVGIITVEMKDGHNLDVLYREVKNEIDQIDNLPEDSERPIVYVHKVYEPVINVALAGNVSLRHLKKYGELIRNELLENREISQVNIQGASDAEIVIKVDTQTLRSLGLDLNSLRSIILSQSMNMPVGSVENRNQEILIRMIDQKYSPLEFGNIAIVSNENGSQVLLSDIAKIVWSQQKKEDICFLNGKRAVILSIRKSDEEDALTTREEVIKYVNNFQEKIPDGMEIKCIEDTSKIINDRLRMLMRNAIAGFVLVFLSLWLFLNIRLAFWVAMGVPFSFLGALWLMHTFGLSLNMITMFSLILGLGLIVDDAIVIGENIFHHLQKGKEPIRACLDGLNQVGKGVVSSFLTTVAVFLPLAFIKGQVGKVLYVLPIGVILGLSISLIEAFFVLPNHLGHSFKDANKLKKQNKIRIIIDNAINYFIGHIFSPFIKTCLQYRYITFSIIIAVFIVSIGMVKGRRLDFIPFPELDGDVIACYLFLPSGTPIVRTKSAVNKIEKAIWDINSELSPLQPGKTDLVKNVKSLYGFNRDADESGTHVATITVELLSSEIRVNICDEIIKKWRDKVGNLEDVVSAKFKQLIIGPSGKPFEILLKSKNLAMLKNISQEVKKKLALYNGVYNIDDNLKPGKLEAKIFTLPIAKTFGLTSLEISEQLNSSFFGAKVQEFQQDDNNIGVKVQFADKDRDSLNDLESFYLMDKLGNQIPLLNVAKIDLEKGYSNIYHVNNKRTVTVSADIDKKRGNASLIIDELKKDYFPILKEKYPGLQVSIEGQESESHITIMSVRKGLFFGVLAIFVILSFVFSSYTQPITVMTAIPFGVVGSIFGLYVLGIDMSLPSMLGYASLCGIVVNDSIVLVHFMKENMDNGMKPIESAYKASVARFRAVFLTSATTIAGLLPLLMERSLQAQPLIPLAVSITFGLMFATIMVLVFVPCVTGIFYDIGLIKQRS